MVDVSAWFVVSALTKCACRLAFPFDALPPGSLVVDVGGGIGSTSMRLAEAHPGLRFVIQDREAVCALGIEVSFGVVVPCFELTRSAGLAGALPGADRVGESDVPRCVGRARGRCVIYMKFLRSARFLYAAAGACCSARGVHSSSNLPRLARRVCETDPAAAEEGGQGRGRGRASDVPGAWGSRVAVRVRASGGGEGG